MEEGGRADDFRYLTGYANPNWTGVYYQFAEYSPDLSVVFLDDALESVCGTGYWILYDATDYDPYSTGITCHFHGVNQCATWDSSCSNVASSLRYAGSPYGLNNDYYNLYEGKSFRGEEFQGDTDAADLGDLDLKISSLMVTGQSGWTFYVGVNFSGPAVCVYADEHVTTDGIHLDYARFFDMSELGLPDNFIRSVERGCLSDRVVGAPPPWR
ncbi:uncharacterized protein LOC108676437 [Hyalella azteca]|uniref:Uncharacterized protein LOC108676437 n=1 Tax=Hyalella azteca TaxID=294128 RepID=A0A8B7P1V7_HYAAZ|nr:uncharacterized protein LOC108676437 [Hyalella azteca]